MRTWKVELIEIDQLAEHLNHLSDAEFELFTILNAENEPGGVFYVHVVSYKLKHLVAHDGSSGGSTMRIA